MFYRAEFHGHAEFGGAGFYGDASFHRAEFAGDARFDGAGFARGVPPQVARFVRPGAADRADSAVEVSGMDQPGAVDGDGSAPDSAPRTKQ